MSINLPTGIEESFKEKYLVFEINQRNYSLPISIVREIMEYVEVDSIPMAPAFIVGAINLRGEVIPVISLAIRFGMEQQAVNSRTCIVIVEVQRDQQILVIGLMVDMVTRVLDLDVQNIDEVPSLGGQLENRFVKGLAKSDERLLAIVEVDELLTVRDMDLLGEVMNDAY
ncbi:chemotaxis protein CheW [Vibrio hannami]|uniref:chemotaxis protein CheW n=1 Tax=Vibrio hannami TaxID=2717094 RepID=UPI00240EB33F|nr:chemotaxis protein CheW [Vibrio hannami]MDG3087919.1 chemotaxis protein CheW [Vibrio hannami]